MARDSRDRQPEDWLHKAKEVTDLGTTATVRQGLPSAVARDPYRRLRDQLASPSSRRVQPNRDGSES